MTASRLSRRRVALGMAVGVVAVLVGVIPAGPWLVTDVPIDRPDAILMLGSHESERLPHTARLAQRWPRAQVLLTDPRVPTPFNCEDCATRARRLEAAGVAARRIRVLGPRVQNTYDEMRVAAGWMRSAGLRRLLVVTSPYHTRRARGLAAAVLPDRAVGVSACPVPGGRGWPWWSRRYDRRYVIYELAALVNNSWRHGISPRVWLVP